MRAYHSGLRRGSRLGPLVISFLIATMGLYGGQAAEAASAVLVGAGNIARCSSSGDEATAKLLDRIPGTVFTLSDNVYESGTAFRVRELLQAKLGPSQGAY